MLRTRVLAVALGVAGALSMLAGPAGAKGISSASFTGPGLPPGGIRVDVGPRDPNGSAMFFQTGAFSVHQGAAPWASGLDRAGRSCAVHSPTVTASTPTESSFRPR